MNSILTIDKLIISYNISWEYRDNIKLMTLINSDYKISVNHFGNELTAFKTESEKEKEIPCKLRLAVEYEKERIGTLYLDCPSKNMFYFKFHKHIFYSVDYTIIQVKELIEKLFSSFGYEYEYHGITRIEIALDTTASNGLDLFIITDLCSSNNYFNSIKQISNNADDFNIIKKFGGRNYSKAKYGVTIPNLKIYHHTKYKFTTCIGRYQSEIFLKCYNKTKKMEDYQKEYFDKKLQKYERIFRIEVSMNSKGISRYNVPIERLHDYQYLKEVYFSASKKRLTFNRFKKSRKTKKKVKVNPPICILNKLDFGIINADHSIIQPIISTTKTRQISHQGSVNNYRGQVGKLISSYLKGKELEQDVAFDKISEIIQNQSLDYYSTTPQLDKNKLITEELIDGRLSKGNYIYGPENAAKLKSLVYEIPNQNTNNITTEIIEETIVKKFMRDKSSKQMIGKIIEIKNIKIA